ncbi:MAG: hypothetical protein NTX66_03190, partial [Candidatus Falkowbacteria bacterium]|nr:hypothetical protein [Candidatus Falkowbacteria bacterium]
METKTAPVGNFLWHDQGKQPKINIVNPQDFSTPEIIKEILGKGLVPNSFGLINYQEIQSRNELSRLFLENPEIREKINAWKRMSDRFEHLPNSENNFLYVYGQEENPYWAMVKAIIKEFDRPDTPQRLKDLIEDLKSSLALEQEEKSLAARISQKLQNVTRMEGVLEIKPFADRDKDTDEKFIVGQKAYSAAWSSGYAVTLPKWTKNFFCRITGIKSLVKSYLSTKVRIKSYRSAAILHFPSSLHNDLLRGIRDLVRPPAIKDPGGFPENPEPARLAKKANDLIKNFCQMLKGRDDLILTVTFDYGESGLTAKVIGLKKKVEEPNFNFALSDFDGYTVKEKRKAEQIAKSIAEKKRVSLEMMGSLAIYDQLNKYFSLFTKTFTLPSTETDNEFKWYALSNLYNSKENRKIYNRLQTQRRFLSEVMDQLNNLCQVVEMFINKADALQIPVCVPEIRNDGRIGISFNGLAPINMMGQGKEMIPFDLPTINGQMICLTGRHGGGKSVTGKSVIESTFLAQSGLPVFADNFSLDVKTVLGSVTNDEGEGSTATVFVNKVKNLLSEIQKVPKEKSLVFVDEIGKGTQELAGFTLGKMILNTLKGKQYSVIFNTQIMALAEYAEVNLNAICLKVDKDH